MAVNVEAPKPTNRFLDKVQNFMMGVNPDRIIVGMSSGYGSTQWNQRLIILDFRTLKIMTIHESLPPRSGTQTDWNEMKAFLKNLPVPDSKSQILSEDFQYGNSNFGNNLILDSIAELHQSLRSLDRLKSELPNVTDEQTKRLILHNMIMLNKHKQELITSLHESCYKLPFTL